MKISNLKKQLLCVALAGGLFFAGYYLIRRFPFYDSPTLAASIGSCAGLIILWSGCWALAEKFHRRWLSQPKKREEIDAYTFALAEMELEQMKNTPASGSAGANAPWRSHASGKPTT